MYNVLYLELCLDYTCKAMLVNPDQTESGIFIFLFICLFVMCHIQYHRSDLAFFLGLLVSKCCTRQGSALFQPDRESQCGRQRVGSRSRSSPW